MELDHAQEAQHPSLRADINTSRALSSPTGRAGEKLTKTWERPGTQQDPSFINKRIDHARQPFTIFDIIRDQQQSLTGANLTTAFVKLAELTTVEDTKQALCTHKIFTEMMLTAAQNARLFSDQDLSKIIWALAKLEAEPPVEVMDSFMCNLYLRMEKVETQALSMAFWGLARLDYVPGEKVLIRSCQTLAERLRLKEGRLSSFARCLWSLAVMGYCPFESILHDFVSLSCTCLGSLTPLEVGQLLWSFIQFGFNPGLTFLDVVDALFCGEECMWASEEISLLFWGMATYSYTLSQIFILKSINLVQNALPECGWSVLIRTLNACARLCFHPGEEFLQTTAGFLTENVHEMYYEAIETVLWSYATFSFHPGCDLLEKLSSKIDGQISLFSVLHLANILWCYALFDFCTPELWNEIMDLMDRLQQHDEDLPPEALYRIYQVSLLKSHPDTGMTENSTFKLPIKIKDAGLGLWKNEILSRRQTVSPFHEDVLRVLGTLNGNNSFEIFQNFCTIDDSLCLSFFIKPQNIGIDLIEPHEFTVNSSQPTGSAIMRTKITRLSIAHLLQNAHVHFLKYTYWSELTSENEKQQCLNVLIFSNYSIITIDTLIANFSIDSFRSIRRIKTSVFLLFVQLVVEHHVWIVFFYGKKLPRARLWVYQEH